ncbi:hypothetical protein [Parahaliea mediterranea]|uniref:Uncharacterized protein n=1 Tax=Parahaliea mediterranea TaxID=651086 RepID=A0A939DDM3_9GAMM|nr:hypothetical protein [Parahaliea mediterranea]MBN7795956.1 hypothetical protein [Parahaliea mediterranea]
MTRTASLLGALLLALLQGCTQWHYELGSPLETSGNDLHRGTPIAEVLLALGPPQRISGSELGYLMAWEYWRIRENTLGLSLGALGVDFLSLDWGGARVSGEFLVLAFDREHRLAAARFKRWDDRRGSGRAIQPSVGIADIIDVDDLVQPMPQHTWGASLFKPLPQTLNTPHAPDAGNAGLEQRGTPSGTGQRSLEME